MRTSLSKLVSQFARGSAAAMVAALVLIPAVGRATDLIWTNSGFISEPPQIDAIHFFNDGYIDIFTQQPFETSNTRTFTNYDTMIGSPGFYFHTAPAIFGQRTPAESFYNSSSGFIQALDVGGLAIGLGSISQVDPSYLWITAENIVNRGILSVGANGWMKLAGTNVNLSRSGLLVTSIVPRGSFNGETNFLPDVAIYDLYWNQTNVANPPGVNTTRLWQSAGGSGIAATPGHEVIRVGGFTGGAAFALQDPIADSFAMTNGVIELTVTNLIGFTNITDTYVPNISMTNLVEETVEVPTNITRQAAFVSVSDPTVMSVGFQWFPGASNYWTPEVSITTVATNVVTADPELNSLYFYDYLASSTNRGILANELNLPNADTYRPNPYVLSRLPLMGMGMPGLGVPDPAFFFEEGVFSNTVVAMDYAAYGAFVDNLPTEPPYIPQATFTNLPGRVQIYADTLDMTRTRLRGEGHIMLRANNFIGSENAIVDAQHLSFQLTSRAENLKFTRLAAEKVARTKGEMYVWSGVWQNEATYITPNWSVITNLDTNGAVVSLDATNTPATNSAIINLHALMIDANNLLSVLPVNVWDLVLRGKNVEVNDSMTVVQNFFTDAQAFTLNGRITFSNGAWSTAAGVSIFPPMMDFVYTNAPNLLAFTNNGTFDLPNSIQLGSDRATPLAALVNTGLMTTVNLNVNSDYFQNSGTIALFGPFNLIANTASLENGQSTASIMRLKANNARLNNYLLDAIRLYLEVPGNLGDVGFGSSNLISVSDGFHMVTRPASGDLLGTTIQTTLRDFVQIDHTWGSADRGASASGYQNNAAVGSLVVSGAAARDPLGYFAGSQPGSALYVDFLDLSELGENIESYLEIAPSLTIYYATARLGFEPPPDENGIPQMPEEFLDGKFGGRLRWVRDYAGGQSSVAVVVDGQTVFMNVALRNSQSIDSDEDGTPNYFDASPLGGEDPGPAGVVIHPTISSIPGNPGKTFSMSWTAAPNTSYEVEVTSDISSGNWQPYQSFTNSSSTAEVMSFTDSSSQADQRFYRIRVR